MAADKKLNSVNSVSDASYIYAETSSGETVKISKESLAGVIGASIGVSNNSFFRMRGNISTSPDDAKLTGLYSYSGGAAINGTSYGILVCFYNDSFTLNYAWGFQIFVGDNNKISMRSSVRRSGTWDSWVQL